MNWFDFILVGVIGVSALISLMRGFVQEALSLVVWILAFWVALSFTEPVQGLLAGYIESPTGQVAVAFAGLFLLTLLLGGMVNHLVSGLVARTGLSGTDRLLGMLFGAARGALLVAVLVLVAGLTTIPQEDWWQDSSLIGHFGRLAAWLRGLLPADVFGGLLPG